ncbi:MerR family transcriptional regulator [Antarcticimicrobium luteum]|uniref:MerR family transcriptional regulator n=1 Tax=Antarcticimicrobium luteum TaxID=2547397 RepID=A0A4R5VAY4_9RHOB|nr:MerR family transcriptional regulator [Antarcticimicrobium luteum]TDK48796.1 MerR family transcriptional regulator [Antarcticimicrobium luteum]
MQIKEAAAHLGVSPRSLRHYEQAGLLTPTRDANGYRHYGPADLRRAGRIRDMIATGFSTREVLAMAPCLSDDGAGACEAGLADLEHKLSQIDRLITDLQARRRTTLERIAQFRGTLSNANNERKDPGHDPDPRIAVPDRVPRRQR